LSGAAAVQGPFKLIIEAIVEAAVSIAFSEALFRQTQVLSIYLAVAFCVHF